MKPLTLQELYAAAAQRVAAEKTHEITQEPNYLADHEESTAAMVDYQD